VKDIFILRGEAAFGPYTKEEVSAYVMAGNILHTDEARKGEEPVWQPVSLLLGIAPPPPKPSAPPPRPIDTGSPGTGQFSNRDVWMGFSVTAGIGALLVIIGMIMAARDEYGFPHFSGRTANRGENVQLAGHLSVLVGFCLFNVLLYRFWSGVSTRENRIRPGQAAGFMFIPLYNFYWQFIAVRGLVVELNRGLQTKGSRMLSVGLATAACVLFCLVWIPGIGALLNVAWVVCAVILWKSIVDTAPTD
jgi:hypothetical protein